MVGSQFEAILRDFETFFRCPLNPGQNDSCVIKMGIGITIQIEMNRYGLLLIGCRIGNLPRGTRFQDNVLKEALKANEFYPPSTGIFGFSQKSNSLFLYLLVDPSHLDADKVANLLNPFISKAKLWTDALTRGDIPAIGETTATQSVLPPSPFGFIR